MGEFTVSKENVSETKIVGAYAPSINMTFIVEDSYDFQGKLVSREVVGMYEGKENSRDNLKYAGVTEVNK